MLSWAGMSNSSEDSGQGPHCLVVRSGSRRCAIPVAAAKLVAKAPQIHPLPGSKPRLLGLAQIAGEPVVVVELQALLDGEGRPGGEHELTVVIRRLDGTSTLGLAVDEAFGVAPVELREGAREDDPGWVAGRGKIGGRTVVVLSPEHLYADVE